jgi:hypothetical protein
MNEPVALAGLDQTAARAFQQGIYACGGEQIRLDRVGDVDTEVVSFTRASRQPMDARMTCLPKNWRHSAGRALPDPSTDGEWTAA